MDIEYTKKLEEENKALQADKIEKDDKIFRLSFQLMELEKEFRMFRDKNDDAIHDEDYRKWRKKADEEIDKKLKDIWL